MDRARLEELYNTKIKFDLQKQLNLSNPMEIPKVSKIVINVGVREAVNDSKVMPEIVSNIAKIAGQAPVRTLARKSIAGFKLREGMAIGVKVTLRRKRMYEFLDKLINLALPEVKDFQGVPLKLDRRGNYNLGVKEWIIFPEITYDVTDKIHGMNITIHTTAENDDHGRELLRSLGMPFRKA